MACFTVSAVILNLRRFGKFGWVGMVKAWSRLCSGVLSSLIFRQNRPPLHGPRADFGLSRLLAAPASRLEPPAAPMPLLLAFILVLPFMLAFPPSPLSPPPLTPPPPPPA